MISIPDRAKELNLAWGIRAKYVVYEILEVLKNLNYTSQIGTEMNYWTAVLEKLNSAN